MGWRIGSSGDSFEGEVIGARLESWRWLNVEQPAYDHARLGISTNGTRYTNVRADPTEITDSAWTRISYDVSELPPDEVLIATIREAVEPNEEDAIAPTSSAPR